MPRIKDATGVSPKRKAGNVPKKFRNPHFPTPTFIGAEIIFLFIRISNMFVKQKFFTGVGEMTAIAGTVRNSSKADAMYPRYSGRSRFVGNGCRETDLRHPG